MLRRGTHERSYQGTTCSTTLILAALAGIKVSIIETSVGVVRSQMYTGVLYWRVNIMVSLFLSAPPYTIV